MGTTVAIFDTMQEADARAGELTGKQVRPTQPGIAITDAMRDKVAGGLPLFAHKAKAGGALDASLFDDVQRGSTAAELLTRIASESASESNRAIAAQLLAFGPDATVGFGNKAGATFQAERPHSDFVASYSPKNHHVSLYSAENAERNLVHELAHAATAQALKKGGRAALQMKALYADLKRGGLLSGMYGMANVDEFVAEAHSNPAFQAALKAIPLAGKYKSMWARFVDIVRQALNWPVEQTSALERALTAGRELMGENGGRAAGNGLHGNIGNRTAINTAIQQAVQLARHDLHYTTSHTIMPVAPEAVAEAQQHGLSIAGFDHAIDGSAITHTRKHHGNRKTEAARGQIAVVDADFAAIPDILAAPDKTIYGLKNDIGRDMIVYVKAMPDGTTAYLEEIRTGRKTLTMQSMRKYPRTTNATSVMKSLRPTSETLPGDTEISIVEIRKCVICLATTT